MDKRRAPKNSVVAIKITNEATSYAEILKKARERISLKDLGRNDKDPKGGKWRTTYKYLARKVV